MQQQQRASPKPLSLTLRSSNRSMACAAFCELSRESPATRAPNACRCAGQSLLPGSSESSTKIRTWRREASCGCAWAVTLEDLQAYRLPESS